MKKYFPRLFSNALSLLFLLLVSSCYQQRRVVNGMNNLKPEDWAGAYAGKLPCPDCPGIETQMLFSNDGSYQRVSHLLKENAKSYKTSGKSWWDQKQGLIIVQDSGSSLSVPYRLNKRGLIMMHIGTGVRPREDRPEYTLRKITTETPTEHYWSLVELNGKPLSKEIGKEKPHILFHDGTGKTDGSGGCNRFSGTFDLRSGKVIVISPLVATRMACPENGVLESEFFQTIEGTSTYTLEADRMTLRRNGKTIAVFEAVWMQ